MAFSTDTSDRPLGLQRLSELDVMEVHATKIRAGSQYEFKERSGQILFSCYVDPKPLASSKMGFNITLSDANEVQVITLRRPKDVCHSEVEVSIQGQLVSVVKHKFSFLKPLLEVKDANGVPVFRFRGPLLKLGNFDYQLTTMDASQPLGAITKQWRGCRKELTTTRDNFTITFPRELDVKYKAACIGACVFIIHARRRKCRRS